MLEKNFCSSPWFHLGINYDGNFAKCRWGKENTNNKSYSVGNSSIINFYQSDEMNAFRSDLLEGKKLDVCSTCHYEESFDKLNGRKRQLNKSGINVNEFNLSVLSSPHYKHFLHSQNNQGSADYRPTDLQIWLGNTCNSACIMCNPIASSKLETEYKTLEKLNPKLFSSINVPNWTKDKEKVLDIAKQISAIDNLTYIHFLGGETLYDRAFYTLCDYLIDTDKAKNIIIGTTTNGTIYSDKIKKYIKTFKGFHLGISIDSVTDLNDYIRWPGKIKEILPNIKSFLQDRQTNLKLYISLRITPTVFSVLHIDQLFDFMIENSVIAESCNILFEPKCLRMEIMPDNIRQIVKQKLERLIETHKLDKSNIVNIRVPNLINEVTANTILDYYKFMREYIEPDDVEQSRHDLVSFIKAFETTRKNSILDYLPEYEEFLRTYGY